MSDRPGRRRPASPQRHQGQASPASSASTQGGGADTAAPQTPPAHLKSPRSLERLRDRVEAAARELTRLREENAALSARIDDLETSPSLERDAADLLDTDPEMLRRKVTAFIEAIDQYLERNRDAQ